ncbi:protein NRT1/ PTR FAMILY 4.6-like [Magnolia sinica]|uniref:protein NRT1/ PTR FAMILY 4.6-like n=1 Tax=Magnolia sinica TaxID=86752 RepID=UPI00265AF251|nr:protein NRT1/ PTR FAMILY 4.6-like [Magnolia sinica]
MEVEGFTDWKGKPINKQKHGGNRAASFIYFLVTALNITYVSNMLNIVTYLHSIMHMGLAASSTTATNFIGVTCAFSLLGGFLSDSYMTRFRTILIFGPIEFLGFGLLALQAHLPSLQPPECDINNPQNKCGQVHGYNAALLYIAIYTIALGEGCVRANLASFGGDQYDDNDLTESRLKSSFFNWFTFSISLGAFTGLIFIVWIENNKGWDYGFALSAVIVLLGLLVFTSGFSFFRNQRPQGSPLTRMSQVFVAAFKKRKLILPENEDDLQQVAKEEMADVELLPHTKGFKWLDKASISYGKIGKWSLCTVTQVEETKIVLRMLPIIISAVLGYLPIPQLMTLTVQQGSTMNTKIGSIDVSPATLLIIPIMFQMVILVTYDRLFVPFARRITGYKSGITNLQRVGVGFISTPLATCVAAIIERKRKKVAEEHGLTDSGTGVPMSVMWLLLQFFAVAINDAFSFVGLLEFFNGEASRGMKSMGTAIFWCVLGLSSLLGSSLVDIVNKTTKHGDGEIGWLEGNNLNKSHLDRFYWLLAALGLLGFFNHLFWAKRYVYRHSPHNPSG